jgi:hypothetical protein
VQRAFGQATLPESVAAVSFVEADQRVIDQVERLGVALERKPALLDEQAVRKAAKTWQQRFVLVVDSRRDTLSVLRSADQSMLSRVFDEGALAHSPYAGALAATELLRLLAYVPVIAVEVPPPLSIASDRRNNGPSEHAIEASPSWSSHWLLSAGGQLMASAGLSPVLFRPELTLGFEAGRRDARSFGLFHLSTAPWGRARRDVPGSQTERVEYRRADVSARLGIGAHVVGGSILGYFSGGANFVATAVDDGETQLGEHRETGSWAGLGGLFRWQFTKHFMAGFGAEIVWQIRPTSYLVRGRTILEEAPFHLTPAFTLGALLP